MKENSKEKKRKKASQLYKGKVRKKKRKVGHVN